LGPVLSRLPFSPSLWEGRDLDKKGLADENKSCTY
jgi:hypothetical protein